MPRVLCVWFPKWPIQRLRHERPELERAEILLFGGQDQRLHVTACALKVGRSGNHVGQPLAEARALLPNAVFLPADVAADHQALRELALDAQRFSPIVGLEEGPCPEVLLCDVTGSTHLWGGEERFIAAVREHWTGQGYRTQLALAASVGASWALAHAVASVAVPAGDEEVALSTLPLELLRLPPEILSRLGALGLRSVRDVLRLPRETLAGRFGVILPQRLDQALGMRPETILCERLREPLTAVREWESPVDDRFAVTLVCRQLLGTLLAIADQPGTGLQELEGELQTEAGSVTLQIRLVEPSRDERHLAHLIDLQLERRAWPGGVIAVRWTVLRLGRLPQVQRSWLDDPTQTGTSPMIVALVDQLSSRLGSDAVLRAEILPDAQPEHAVYLAPWTGASKAKPRVFSLPPEQSRSRPLRLLRNPEPIKVVAIVPAGPPIRVTLHDQSLEVVRHWGPERIATGWWRAADVRRDYYRTELKNGSHVWIYQDQRDDRWFLHGFFE